VSCGGFGVHSNIIFYLFAGIVIVGILVTTIGSRIRAKKRTQALQTAAQELGFAFEGEGWSDPTRAPQLETALFTRGRYREFRNIMTGTTAGFKVGIFDYTFITRAGKSSHTWTQTVTAFTQELGLPLFEMRPESFMDRVGDAFVHQDIKFDSHPDFSRRYLLRGPDPEKIRELFSPALLTFCEGLAAKDKWHVEGCGASLIVYRSEATVDAAEVRSFLDETSSIARNFIGCCGLRKSA